MIGASPSSRPAQEAPHAQHAPPAEPLAAAFARPVVYGLCAGLLLYSMASPLAAIAGAGGALAGGILGLPLGRSRLRSPGLWLATALGIALSVALRALLTTQPSIAQAVGPAAAVDIGNRLLAGLGFFSLATGLRATALRHPAARVLEVALIAFAFAEPFVAHRGGHINRPFELADSIIAEGGDPAEVFRLVGAVAGGVAIAFLFASRSLWRTLLHVGVLAVLIPLLVLSGASMSIPEGADPLGLRGGKDGKPSKPQHGRDGQGRPQSEKSDNQQLEFKDQYDDSGRRVPLAVVLLHDDYSPPSGMYYFRQEAFSHYNGRRLVVTTEAGFDDDTVPAFVAGKTAIASAPTGDDRTVLDTTVALLADHARPFALEAPVSLEPTQNPDPSRFRRVYRVTSSALDAEYGELLWRDVGDPLWDADKRAHYLEAPRDERYAQLAQTIRDGLDEAVQDVPVARALAIALWLGEQGTYSLKSGHAGAEDPTADFLFGDKVGYCVHFAHASVYLMRALGIPARIGTGYVVEESARQGGSAILLTGANSHAWPELYIEGAGWVIMDVAPERALDAPPPPPDPDLQRLLGEMARGLKPIPQTEDRIFQPVVAAANRAFELARIAVLVGVPACLLLLYLVKLWRRVIPRLSPVARLPRLAYRAELDRLSELALRRRYGESREHFAARVEAQLPSFGRLTRHHTADRYGGSGRLSRAQYDELARELRRERRAVAPLHRRLSGLLLPWSWLLAR